MKRKIGLYLQGFITLVAILFAVIALFDNNYFIVIQILLGLDLLVIAYNNLVLYNKKIFTILYAVAGVFVLLISLVGLWW